MNKENKIRIFTTITEEEANEQEQFGSSQDHKKKKMIEMKYSEIETQLRENIFPLIYYIDTSNKDKDSSLKLSKISLKLGFSFEGNIFIASGKIESAIELEFTK